MRKRILSLLLCIVLCLSFAPTAVFAASDIGSLSGNGNIEDREWNLRLDENGILHWDNAVEGPHIIQLYYNGIAAGANMNATGDSWDLQSYMRDAKKVTGKYTILFNGSSTVRNSEEVSFYYISPLAQLSAPANLSWNGQAGTWDAVPNATQYRIYLRHGDGNLRDTYYTNNTSYDFGTMAQDGFVFEVVATADNYLYSNAVTSPRYGSSQPGTITVTYDANGGTGTMAQETYTLDSEGWVKNFTVPECRFTAPAGKEFDRWEDANGTPYQVGGTPWIAESMILKAIWKDTTIPQPGTITVTYDANGGTGTMAQETYTLDSEGWVKNFTVPECRFTAPAGKEFDRWEDANGTPYQVGGTPWIAESMILKAIWKDTTIPQPGTITVTYDANGGTGTMAQETYTLDSEGWVKNFTVPECRFTAPAGKEFDRWEDANGTPYQVGGTPWIAESMILKAIWKDTTIPQPGTITVTYDANGGTGTMAQETYTLDSEGWVKNFTVPECRFTAPAGKEFDRWEDANGTPYQVGGTPWIAESMILKAIWKDSTTPQPTTYTVSFEMNSHGDQIAAQTVNEGAKATKPTDPTASGWTFDGWYADATFSAAFDFDTAIAADTTIYAKWTANSVTPPTPANYTVTFNMNGHGTQVAAQTVEDGNKATKPADPTASGYTFGGWYADATFSTKFDFNSAITANTTVYAKWTKNSVAPTDPTTPQTGDNSNMFLWIVLLFVSGGALAGTAVYGKKKKYRAE